MEFDWDPQKATSNLAKHGLDFADGVLVFGDPSRIERADRRFRAEQRFQAIGGANGRLLFVAYTIRGQVYRIISVRSASRRERTAYSLQAGHRP